MIRILAAGVAIDDMHHCVLVKSLYDFSRFITMVAMDRFMDWLAKVWMDMKWAQLIGDMMIDIGGDLLYRHYI